MSTIRARQLLAGKIAGIGALGLLQLLGIATYGIVLATVTGALEVPAHAVGTALLAIASAAVFGTLTWRQADAARTPAPTVELAGEPYKPSVENAPPVKAETWGAPGPQSRGRDWIYDAFTSPEIFYNARSRQFTVRPPSSLAEPEAIEEAFGLELLVNS